MLKVDVRDCPVTGASPGALEHFERALTAFQLCRGDPLVHLRDAIAEAPEFAMARIVEAHLRLGGRDPWGADKAAHILGDITLGRLNSRERVISRRSPRQSQVSTRPRAGSSRACSASTRATRWRCRWRTLLITSGATRTPCA